jgi:hypothetical protein
MTREGPSRASNADPAVGSEAVERRARGDPASGLRFTKMQGLGNDFVVIDGYRIFNADGGEVEQCGNGARCFVVFVRERGLTAKREIRVETAGGLIVPRLEDDGEVTVDMGAPRFEPAAIPFTGGTGAIVEPLDVEGAIHRRNFGAFDGQSARRAGRGRRRCRAGDLAGRGDRASSAVPATRQRRIHAGDRSR